MYRFMFGLYLDCSKLMTCLTMLVHCARGRHSLRPGVVRSMIGEYLDINISTKCQVKFDAL